MLDNKKAPKGLLDCMLNFIREKFCTLVSTDGDGRSKRTHNHQLYIYILSAFIKIDDFIISPVYSLNILISRP